MKEPLKFFFVAGEPSGDLHGAKLIKAIKSLNPFTSSCLQRCSLNAYLTHNFMDICLMTLPI